MSIIRESIALVWMTRVKFRFDAIFRRSSSMSDPLLKGDGKDTTAGHGTKAYLDAHGGRDFDLKFCSEDQQKRQKAQCFRRLYVSEMLVDIVEMVVAAGRGV